MDTKLRENNLRMTDYYDITKFHAINIDEAVDLGLYCFTV